MSLLLSNSWLRISWSPKEDLREASRTEPAEEPQSLMDLEISPRVWLGISHLQLQGDYERERERDGGQRKLRKSDAENVFQQSLKRC